MSPRTLGNIQNEIMTNLQLTDLSPIQGPTTDDSSMSGVTKVLLKLIRKVNNDRVMHSAKPLRHTVYLFCSVPERYEKGFTSEKVIQADVKRGNALEPNNSLYEAFSKLDDGHVRLVWVNLGKRNDEAQAQQTRQPGLGSKSSINCLPENFPVRITNLHSFLHREPPQKQMLATSLRKRLESARNECWQNEGSRINAQIVFEQPNEHPTKLKLLTSVTIHSLQSSSKGKRATNIFILSHYLKDSEPFVSENALSAKRSHPRTIRPRSGHDVSSFSSFVRYLKQMHTLAVAKEISVDHKQRTLSCRSVLIVPYSTNVATLHRLPNHHSCHSRPRDSNVPKTYDQWMNWYNGGRAIQTDPEVKSDRGTLILNEPALAPSVLGLENRVVSVATAKDNSSHLPRNHGENGYLSNNVKLSTGRLDGHPKPFAGHVDGRVNPKARLRSVELSTSVFETAQVSPRPALASAQITHGDSLRTNAIRVSTVTKNGFRYKRVSAGSSDQDIADKNALRRRLREVSDNGHKLCKMLNPIQRSGTEGASGVYGGEMDKSELRERKLDQPNTLLISNLACVYPKRMPTASVAQSEFAKHNIGQRRLERSECIGKKEFFLSCGKRKHETEDLLNSTSTDVAGFCDPHLEQSDSPPQNEQKQTDEKHSPLKGCRVHALKEQSIDSATDCPVRDEDNPALTCWEDALHQEVQSFEGILVHLSNCSDKKPSPLVQEAMRSLSRITMAVSRQSQEWASLRDFATRRLKDHGTVIDSIQAAQKCFYSNESEQTRLSGGKLWKVMIEALEQVMWLVSKVLDPGTRTSKKRKKKPETLNRATTILSCVQVMGQLASSLFDSPDLFDIVFERFFDSVLIHLAQTSPNEELKYWARDVFEHFEKEVTSAVIRAGHTVKGSTPSEPVSGKARDLNFQSCKVPDRTVQHKRKRKMLNSSNDTSRRQSKRKFSQLSAGRKLSANKAGALQHHPAFRRGKAFTGQRRKRKTAMKKTTPTISCPTNALDRLVHTGSLQSSLDAIKLPESSDDDLDGDEIEASDNECVKLIGHDASNSERQSMENPSISSGLNQEVHNAHFREMCLSTEGGRNAETGRTGAKSDVTPRDGEAMRYRNDLNQKKSERAPMALRSSSAKERINKTAC